MNRLTAIVVTYNTQDTIIPCLTSLKDHLPASSQIVVVDNCSSDKTVELIQKFIQEHSLYNVVFYALERNLGFGAGNNYAMSRHPSKFYYLHNGDAYLKSSETIKNALDLFEDEPKIGIVGLPLTFPDGSVQTAAFAFMSLRKMSLQAMHVHTLARSMMKRSSLQFVFKALSRFSIAHSFVNQHLAETDNKTHQAYDWVCGAALLLRKEVYDATGGFDESIFLYGEDELLSYRSTEQGYQTVQLFTDAVVHDFGWGKHQKKNAKVQKLKYEGLSHVIDCYHPQSNVASRLRRKMMKGLIKYHIRMNVT